MSTVKDQLTGRNPDSGAPQVLLDTAADAAAAGGVAVSGAVIAAAGGLYWLDPAVALAIAVIVGYHALALMGKIIAVLRSAQPSGAVEDGVVRNKP